MKSKRKLVLRPETIRALVHTDLAQARGGGSDEKCGFSLVQKLCPETNLNPTTAGG